MVSLKFDNGTAQVRNVKERVNQGTMWAIMN